MIHFDARNKIKLILAGFILAFWSSARPASGDQAPGSGSDPSKPAPLKVVCTIGMIADIARSIGGDKVEVAGIMGEGVDPHLYKASPGDVRLMSQADAVFYNGLHLEGRMADVLVKMAGRKPTFAVSENIDEKLLREPPEFAGHFDPHIWFNVELWGKAAERVRDALVQLDPKNREYFEEQGRKYLQALTALHQWVKLEIAQIPRGNRVLITAHDAFGYFGDAYDIEVMGIQGISTDSEPSLKDINHLVDLITARKIKAVFVESSVPRKTVDALTEGCRSRGHEVVVGGQLFSDAMGRSGTPEGTYEGMIRHNVNTIVSALK